MFFQSEQERNIVSQSAFSSDDYAKKDKCLVRPMSALSVTKSAGTVNSHGNYDKLQTDAYSFGQITSIHMRFKNIFLKTIKDLLYYKADNMEWI